MLLALSMLAGIQSLRVLFALVNFSLFPTISFQNSALLLVVVFTTPFWLPLCLARLKSPIALLVVVGGLSISRLALQFSSSASLSLILAVVAVILWLQIFSLRELWIGSNGLLDPYQFASWIVVGLALDAALNSLFITWDYAWQRDAPSLLCALVVAGLMGAALIRHVKNCVDLPTTNIAPLTPYIALIGAYLMLQLVVLQNPAFVSTTTNVSIPIACSIVLLGNIVSLSPLLNKVISAAAPYRLLIACVMVVGLFALNELTGVAAAVTIIGIQFAATTFLYLLLQPAAGRVSLSKNAVSLGSAGLLMLSLTAAYYIGYQYHAPDSASAFVLAGAGVLLAGSVFRPPEVYAETLFSWQPLKVVIPLLLIPIMLWVTRQPVFATGVDSSFRLVSYNIHQGANVEGWINLEALAEVIEAQNPDIAVLQEVVRGQFITGATDIAQWLAVRLGMNFHFAPAMDSTYGVLLLTRLPLREWQANYLPRAGAVQRRGYFYATLNLNERNEISVIGTHLDHTSSQARVEQAQHLVTVWDGNPHTILAGDLNAQSGTAEIEVFRLAQMIDAQDAIGNGLLATFPSTAPSSRIDWIFGTPDLVFRDFFMPSTLASDHLPLAVTVEFQ